MHSNKLLFCGFLFLLLSAGCNSDLEQPDPVFTPSDPLVMVIKDRSDESSEEISAQILKALEYSKIPYTTTDLTLIGSQIRPAASHRVIVFTTDKLLNLPDDEILRLADFVAAGNSIVFAVPAPYEQFGFLMGIKSGSNFLTDRTSSGFRFNAPVLPGMESVIFNPIFKVPHFGIKKEEWSNDIQILATAPGEEQTPLILKNQVGLGSVITFNSYSLFEKEHRGLLFTAIARSLNGLPYMTANVATIFLDDFPAPLYNEKLEPIDKEYDSTHADFVANIWWPDMQALADTFGLAYSAMLAFNYNAAVVPPFDFLEWKSGTIRSKNSENESGSPLVGRNVSASRHELAFHGYNHFSLWLQDWDNDQFMFSSLQAARKQWLVDGLGKLPRTYVPPTNNIDSVGLKVIPKAMPSIRYMSSLYLGDMESGGGREFDPDPYEPFLYSYPRISSGFNMAIGSLYNQQNLQVLTGIWTHFVHPDDVFQVFQRDEDIFASRNVLGLGWKKTDGQNYGLYHLLRERVMYTKKNYPNIRFLTAEKAGLEVEKWRAARLSFDENDKRVDVQVQLPNRFLKSAEDSRYLSNWHMFVAKEDRKTIDEALSTQKISAYKVPFWDGFLYQFSVDTSQFFLPNLKPDKSHDPQFILAQVNNVRRQLRDYTTQALLEEQLADENWEDTRYKDAVAAWEKKPDDIPTQEKLIAAAIEFEQVHKAIEVLEHRIFNSSIWYSNDIERLTTYYGWEQAYSEAGRFLERLWFAHKSKAVIELKNVVVSKTGLSDAGFDTRWMQREFEFITDESERLSIEIRQIEGEENWEMLRPKLFRLIALNPDSDSLYAYTLQRIIWYENPDSVAAAVDAFPRSSHEQLLPFAANLAFIYGYDKEDPAKGLYWADKSSGFSERTKLDWILQQRRYVEFRRRGEKILRENPSDDSTRVYVGTQLIYAGFTEEGNAILYPLFKNNTKLQGEAGQVITDQIRFGSYEEKKALYRTYPAFFNKTQRDTLLSEYRFNEGVKATGYAEYQSDNFDNELIRLGTSVSLGNRLRTAHVFKAENLWIDSRVAGTLLTDISQAVGYEFSYRNHSGSAEFRVGTNALTFNSTPFASVHASLSYSKDSTFTSGNIALSPVFTNSALEREIYELRLGLYREDFWFNGKAQSAISITGRQYTNSIRAVEIFSRGFYNIENNRYRIRPIIEFSYANASTILPSSVPFFTPDNLMTQGIGFDVRYRNPNNFNPGTFIEFELMGKNQTEGGVFFTTRSQLFHRFGDFWEASITNELSNSDVFRSNRFFVTLSYYFRKRVELIPGNSKTIGY